MLLIIFILVYSKNFIGIPLKYSCKFILNNYLSFVVHVLHLSRRIIIVLIEGQVKLILTVYNYYFIDISIIIILFSSKKFLFSFWGIKFRTNFLLGSYDIIFKK